MAVDNIQPPQEISHNTGASQVMSMADLLAQEDLSLPVLKTGEIVKGVVAKKTPTEIFVDIGAKSEGVVDSKDLSKLTQEEISQINVGDTVFVYILDSGGDDEDRAELSLSQAKAEQDWDLAARLFKSGESVSRPVVGYNKGGLIVEFGQLRGFVPGSQVVTGQAGGVGKSTGRWNQMVGKTLSLKIIEVDRERNRLILSERIVVDEAREKDNEKRSEFLHTLAEGQKLTGRITRLVEFGAFVDIGGGIDGLIHLSELAWARILHPNEILNVGDEVEVYVLSVDADQQRVALSLKRLQPEPWSEVFSHYQINQVVEAVITKLTDFGAFARIDDRIEGLIHISEITSKNITHPNQVVNEGDKLQVRIINIDPERRRMGLSIKQVDESAEDWAAHAHTETESTPAEAALIDKA